MQTQKILRPLLLPFSWLYGGFMALRNLAVSRGLKKSFKFDFPVICVGNLSTGGTGKTPHIEFLISALKEKYKMGVVSRGYGRKTRGFFIVDENSTPDKVGDEPLQIKLNHPQANVAVGEERIIAIPTLLHEVPETEVILLDDAYQHRYVKAGLYILLTDYSHLFYNDFVLPAGNLREFRAGYKRADCIIVTKCPEMGEQEKKDIIKKINPLPHQQVFFTGLKYGMPYRLFNAGEKLNPKQSDVFFFAGIANASPVERYLQNNSKGFELLKLADHYEYTPANLTTIIEHFKNRKAEHKIFLTTQKDAVKLMQPPLKGLLQELPLYVLPLEISMDETEKAQFIARVETYIQKDMSKHTEDLMQ